MRYFVGGLACAAGGSGAPFPGEAVGGCAEGASGRLRRAAFSRVAAGCDGGGSCYTESGCQGEGRLEVFDK